MEQMDNDKKEELISLLDQIRASSWLMQHFSASLICRIHKGDLELIDDRTSSIRKQLCEISVLLHQIDEVSGWNEQWKNNY